jgi:cytochrome P450
VQPPFRVVQVSLLSTKTKKMASSALFAAGAVLFFLYFVLISIWNVYLHALRRVPGPGLWIVLPVLRHISGVRGRLDIDMRRFHAQYGEAVRFGPSEVSFITPDAWKSIYGHPQLPKVLMTGSKGTDLLSADDRNHSRYRKALSPAFSARGLQAQEPHIIVYVEKLISRLKGIAESQLPVDMVKWYNLTTFDLIGDLAFGQSFGGLDSSEYHHWVSTIFNFVKVVPFLKLKDAYPVVLPLLMALLPKKFLETHKRQAQYAKETVHKRLDDKAAYGRGDFMDFMVRHRGEKDGLSDEELEVNATLLIFAGSETTATLLSGVTYWLLKSPEALAKVTAEIRTIPTEAEINRYNVTNQLPYMHACIEEALRLYPPLPSGPQRRAVVPCQISGYDIPPGVSPP